MSTILVTGASGIIGYGILKSIRMSSSEYHLIGTTIHTDSVALAFCDQFLQAPLTQDDQYIDWLLRVITDYRVDLLIPGFEDDVRKWDEYKEVLLETGAKLVLNTPDIIRLCEDKWDFYEYLKANKYPYTIPTDLSGDYQKLLAKWDLPLLLKPRQGSESKGIVQVYDEATFQKHSHKIGDLLMVQPLIGCDEEEYTTAVFGDGTGNFTSQITLKRKLAKLGYTEKAEPVSHQGITEATLAVCKILKPIGPTNLQFRIHEDQPYLLEINPRFSSATSIRSALGYNEAAMAIDYYLANRLPVQPEIKKGRAVRYIEDHIFFS